MDNNTNEKHQGNNMQKNKVEKVEKESVVKNTKKESFVKGDDRIAEEFKIDKADNSKKERNEIENLKNSIEELEEKNSLLEENMLRKQADFENSRKRLCRDRDEAVKYANQVLLFDLITVIDDFERAIKSSEESKDFKSFHNGITLIEKQLISMLEKKWGLIRFNSLGEKFNPQKHQAIAMEENEKHNLPTVIEDYQKGYLFHERVIRPAKVKVSQPGTVGVSDNKNDNKKSKNNNKKKGNN